MNEQFDKALADIYGRFLAVKVQISHADLWLGTEDYFSRVDLEVRRSTRDDEAMQWIRRADDVVNNIRYLNRHWRPVEGSNTQKYTGYFCSKCQAPTVPSCSPPTDKQMIERKLCFHCNYWVEEVNNILNNQNPRRVIINHHVYIDHGLSNDKPAHLGFGGSEFSYRRIDSGEVITTNNMWSGEALPAEYWAKVPDNAEFVKS